MNLEEATIKYLCEAFRDCDKQIDDIENELSDLLLSYNSFIDLTLIDLKTFELDDELRNDMYDEDLQRYEDLQKELINLYNKRETEYRTEINDLPLETNKTNFEGFDLTITDPPR